MISAGIAASLGGCVPVPAPPPPAPSPGTLSQVWMIGIERMQGDSLLMLPFTNRFLAVLAGMPKTQVVFVASARNDPLFSAYPGNKLRVYPWLRGEGNCMEFTYSIFATGLQEARYSLIVPALAAGYEPDSACVDRAATGFYQALAIQGL
jgi:hypothetical protein